jgi:hypothetical protein
MIELLGSAHFPLPVFNVIVILCECLNDETIRQLILIAKEIVR